MGQKNFELDVYSWKIYPQIDCSGSFSKGGSTCGLGEEAACKCKAYFFRLSLMEKIPIFSSN